MPKLRVLLVDDQEDLLVVFRRVLVARGMEVVGEAANGAEALEVLRHVAADVVLTDYKMPMMDGVALARAITAEGGAPIIIVLSAFVDPSLVEEGQAAGVTAWLPKGLRPRELCERIHEIAGREAGDDDRGEAVGAASQSMGVNRAAK
jgi:DNA-binding NarL/FixJ family response regulator